MTAGVRRAPRRAEALTREAIIEAALRMLDAGGEQALTLRALSADLRTGHGAIYHHVEDMGDVLAAATDEIVTRALRGTPPATEGPRQVLHAVALSLFDVIAAHPWAGAHVATAPWRPARADIYETVGEHLHAFGVPEHHLSDAAGVLVNHILGVAGQNAANTRALARSQEDRTTFLAEVADQWSRLDPDRFPRLHRATNRVVEHDDREQFLAGVNLILAGIDTVFRDGEE